ncbi:hypothetical protein K505DRAFT_370017 [Melanomma pulvis-pyrius CBS 109.77]|uniref:Uncharacterized protein n=1 Tax=Melanomma pulvis-pyrius CBS 109.77 TaxID=1314802 RepID=A0A6A6XY72_9PLEO|nr:hypothetical protein K505DRAFT_370017 [Melanomma pulvis-pyrius CBS 109.77]
MLEKSCHYDCSMHPDQLSPYPDISGIGVFLAYAITTGLTVMIMIAYFLVAYRPDEDPFGGKSVSQSDVTFHPNATDMAIVAGIQRLFPFLRGSRRSHHRLYRGFTKAMLTMSDIQLLTGLSIIISGYTQLRCGLSAYHWQKIVNIAWFTSTTHLSCLTFLRNYLSQRKAQRIWRVLAMGTLVLLLLVAIVRTRYFIFE